MSARPAAPFLCCCLILGGCSFGSDAVYPALTGMEDLRHPPVGEAPQLAPEPVIPTAPTTPEDLKKLNATLAGVTSDIQRIQNGWETAAGAIAAQQADYEKARARAAGSARNSNERNVAQAELSRLSTEISRAEGVASEAGGPAASLAQLIAAVQPMQEPDARALAGKSQALLLDFGRFIDRMARANKTYAAYLSAESAVLDR